MSDGLRFIRFSVASPAGENRVVMLCLTLQPSWDISTQHPILLAREALVQDLILQGHTPTPGAAYNRTLPPASPTHASRDHSETTPLCCLRTVLAADLFMQGLILVLSCPLLAALLLAG